MIGRRLVVAFFAAGLAACSTASAVVVDDAASVPQTTLTTLIATTGIDPGDVSAEEVPEAALFLAAVDQAMAGTSYEGDAFEDPETFLGTGVLFCELLESGLTAEEVLTAYVLALPESDEATADDDILLGGVVLGVGVETLCPVYTPALGGVTN